MKKLIFASILTLSSLAFSGTTRSNGDIILGTWLTSEKDGHVTIYKDGGKYFGKLTWLKEPNDAVTGKPKTDKNNPDKNLQTRPVLGMQLLLNFEYDEDDQEWEDGQIYDPKSGKTYSCVMELLDNGELEVTGYIGLSFIGKTVVWTKVK